MNGKVKLAAMALICVMALALGQYLPQAALAACPNTYCKTTQHTVTNSNSLPCGSDDSPCYGQTIEKYAQQCSGGAPGKECTTYTGWTSKTTTRTCAAGVCVVTGVGTVLGAGARCVTTVCPVETEGGDGDE